MVRPLAQMATIVSVFCSVFCLNDSTAQDERTNGGRFDMDDQQLSGNNKDLQIEELEKLLNQSIRGFHHLFDKSRITEILKTPTEELDFFTTKNMNTIQKLFDELIKKKTMQEKQAYIEHLDEGRFEILLRTYFHIVDTTLMSSEHMKH
jgi:hypothetical protein